MSDQLKTAFSALVEAATASGLPAQSALTEGRVLSAAIAEANRGAYLDWCAALELPASAQAFTDAAVAGRRYRASATPLATQAAAANATSYPQALAQVCHAAATLGQTTPEAIAAATMAASAQLPTGQHYGFSATPGLSEAAAQQQFLSQAPTILGDVLSRISTNQSKLLDLGRLDPNSPGAFPGLGNTWPAPANPVSAHTDPSNPAVPTAEASIEPAVPQPAPAQPTEAEPAEPAQPEKTVEEWLAELDELVGLAKVKTEIHRQTAILRVDALRTKAGLKSPTITRHLVFTGNPGTGKTTVARMVAGIYKAIGLLSKGQLVEVDRSELVAGLPMTRASSGRLAVSAASASSSAQRSSASSSFASENAASA